MKNSKKLGLYITLLALAVVLYFKNSPQEESIVGHKPPTNLVKGLNTTIILLKIK